MKVQSRSLWPSNATARERGFKFKFPYRRALVYSIARRHHAIGGSALIW
jgi:CRISPR/Cas system endoribonuclease Cas6 (RAMP superfamily)